MVTSTPRRPRSSTAAAKGATPTATTASTAQPAPAPRAARAARTPKTAKASPTATAPAVSTAAVTAAPEAPELKLKKVPMVRDSFTMPQAEYALIADLKARCLQGGRHAKKSELLRAGLQLLAQQDAVVLAKTLASLPPIKVGRPGKSR